MTSVWFPQISQFSQFNVFSIIKPAQVFSFRNDGENMTLDSVERRQREHNFNYIASKIYNGLNNDVLQIDHSCLLFIPVSVISYNIRNLTAYSIVCANRHLTFQRLNPQGQEKRTHHINTTSFPTLLHCLTSCNILQSGRTFERSVRNSVCNTLPAVVWALVAIVKSTMAILY